MDIPVDDFVLKGDLFIPEAACGLVIFAHGSGSSRQSPRNQFVAKKLNQVKLATLLFDLLTEEEETIDIKTAEFRFDIELLSTRLMKVTRYFQQFSQTKHFKMGYFGASTGACAALIAAAKEPKSIRAVVSRGGRPDLAKGYLKNIQAPTLLIVGGNDSPVIEMNQEAFRLLSCEKEIEIVPDATHLFEEPGKLERVADLAKNWFLKTLLSS